MHGCVNARSLRSAEFQACPAQATAVFPGITLGFSSVVRRFFGLLAVAMLHAPALAQAASGFALSFERGSGQSVWVTNFGLAAPTNEMTIEFWQRTDAEAGPVVFALETGDPHNGVRAMVPREDGSVCWEFGDGQGAGCLSYWPPDFVTGAWQHFALVVSEKGNFMRVYRNGVEEARKTGMTPLRRAAGDLVLAPNRPEGKWAGRLDEFRVWRVARSQEQIQQQMRGELSGKEAGLVAYWQFDEGVGSVAGDSSGNERPGHLVNDPVWHRSPMPPVLTSALSFNGPGHGVRLPGGDWLGEEFTIEAWVYQRSVHNSARLLEFGNGEGAENIRALLSLETSGYPALSVCRGQPPEPARKSIVRSSQKIPLNVWTHVAFSRDASGSGRVYVNALEVGSGPLLAPRPGMRTNNFIGGGRALTDGTADAIFDEIRVWGVARTSAELGAAMRQLLTGAEAQLIAYWRCDEGRGTTVRDASGHTNTGTLVGNPKWVGAAAPLWQGPVATTGVADAIASAGARLNGAVYPNAQPTVAWFEWGSTVRYGQRTRATPLGDDSNLAVLSEQIQGIELAVHYHYRMACSNSAGISFGADQSFSLPAGTLLGLTLRTWCLALVLPFVAGAALFAGTLRFRFVRRLKRKLEKLRVLQTLEAERGRIARDLHDDLGARLTKITMLTELARRESYGPKLATDYIQRISVTANETAQALEEIVWAVNPDNDTLDRFGSYLCRVAEGIFSNTPIRCRLNVPALLPALALPAAFRHHLLMAAKEALNNSLKHSAASEAVVSLATDRHQLTLTIEDNGRGFDFATITTGNGLANLRRRMETIGGTCRFENPHSGGTRIVLSVQLMEAQVTHL